MSANLKPLSMECKLVDLKSNIRMKFQSKIKTTEKAPQRGTAQEIILLYQLKMKALSEKVNIVPENLDLEKDEITKVRSEPSLTY